MIFIKNLIKKNKINILLIFVFFILLYNFFLDPGYWYDEWATLFSSDPKVSINEIYLRINGTITGVPENVPPYYYLILRIYFKIFGFTAENGRIFSIIFFLLSIFIFSHLSKNTLGSKNYFPALLMFALNPLLIWMANETRTDTFIIFFTTVNLLIFLKCISEKNNIYYFFLLISNIIILSVYPLTFSLIFAQSVLLFTPKIFIKNKKILISLIFFSLIIYILLNHNYLADKLHNSKNHYASLHVNFFIGYFFNIFFGNVFFGAIYLVLFVLLIFKNIKQNFEDPRSLFLIFAIISTYSMIIISSLFFVPIAAPRYVIFLIPVIILYLNLSLSKTDFKLRSKILNYIIIALPIINIIFTNTSKPIKKPPINEALKYIESNKFKNIYSGEDIYFSLYVSTIESISKKKFFLVKKNDLSKKINEFAYLCINNPSFAVGKKIMPDEKKCLVGFDGFSVKKSINIQDFKIIFFTRL